MGVLKADFAAVHSHYRLIRQMTLTLLQSVSNPGHFRRPNEANQPTS